VNSLQKAISESVTVLEAEPYLKAEKSKKRFRQFLNVVMLSDE